MQGIDRGETAEAVHHSSQRRIVTETADSLLLASKASSSSRWRQSSSRSHQSIESGKSKSSDRRLQLADTMPSIVSGRNHLPSFVDEEGLRLEEEVAVAADTNGAASPAAVSAGGSGSGSGSE
eukprot:CAMPEP_0113559488 /NCGR_PEP_ID=MMETSP0015_2-20120614/18923_1 /TAXON_ID=2838 /ORGANISM="Odontella" /LENGTH=122 /DNA_ID=CAMNT_0000461127 /DNA_START=549 /DNA_END=914 /DNA_ORIENTATION=- /assembly_acc=CAM_ASM_000160